MPFSWRDDADVWDQQSGESAPAFEAFRTYRDQGAQRSTAAVGRSLGKSKALMDRWSSANNWSLRAASWDEHEDKARQAAKVARAVEMTERHASYAQAMLEALIAPSRIALERMTKEPDAFTAELAKAGAVKLLALAARAAGVIDNVVEVERVARGLPTDFIQVTDDDDDAFARAVRDDPGALAAYQRLLESIGDGAGETDAAGPGEKFAGGPGDSGESGQVDPSAAPTGAKQ